NARYDYYDYYTAKYAAADGTLLWEKRYNGPVGMYDQGSALAVDGHGNVVMTVFFFRGNASNIRTVKYAAADGALLWERRYNGPVNRYARSVAVGVDDNGNVVMTGNSWKEGNTYFYTAKYASADGALLWEKRGAGGYALALDGSGNVVVAGDCSTAK